MISRRPGGRRKKIPKILLQQHHQQPTDDVDDDAFFRFFPQNSIMFNTAKMLQTLNLKVPSGMKKCAVVF